MSQIISISISTVTSYIAQDDNVREVLTSLDLDSAKIEAERSWQSGSWDHHSEIDVTIHEVITTTTTDEDGDETETVEYGRSETIYVEVGEVESEPACAVSDEHDWCQPHAVVGGLDSNPGVWSGGGTALDLRSVCSCCGMYRDSHHAGSQRNPGEDAETTTYLPADEVSLRWIAR